MKPVKIAYINFSAVLLVVKFYARKCQLLYMEIKNSFHFKLLFLYIVSVDNLRKLT